MTGRTASERRGPFFAGLPAKSLAGVDSESCHLKRR